jgi:biopolymer transport protein ExbB/TolQ
MEIIVTQPNTKGPGSKAGIMSLALLLMNAGGLYAAETPSVSIPVLDVLGLGGWICYPIYALLLLGVVFSVSRILQIRFDSSRGQATRNVSAKGFKAGQLLEKLKTMPESELSVAARDMLTQFINSRNHDSLGSNVERFMTVRQDWFKPYLNWMEFLSESAGALGLLGTVLGMFQTFFGGTLDKDKILHGMGVALITTLVGILVSLLLNLALTLVRNHYDKILDGQYRKLSEFKQAMLVAGSLDDTNAEGQ